MEPKSTLPELSICPRQLVVEIVDQRGAVVERLEIPDPRIQIIRIFNERCGPLKARLGPPDSLN